MINKSRLKLVEDMINSQPCKFCGKKHRVSIVDMADPSNFAHSSASSSTVVHFPLGERVSVGFDESSCIGIKEFFPKFVASQADKIITLPFDNI